MEYMATFTLVRRVQHRIVYPPDSRLFDHTLTVGAVDIFISGNETSRKMVIFYDLGCNVEGHAKQRYSAY